MKTSVETIKGKLCTVIRKPFDLEGVREHFVYNDSLQLEIQHSKYDKDRNKYYLIPERQSALSFNEARKIRSASDIVYIITALPALPRNPTPEDAPLFSVYESHGLFAIIDVGGDGDLIQPSNISGKLYITEGWNDYRLVDGVDSVAYVSDKDGNRVEIAIEGGE